MYIDERSGGGGGTIIDIPDPDPLTREKKKTPLWSLIQSNKSLKPYPIQQSHPSWIDSLGKYVNIIDIPGGHVIPCTSWVFLWRPSTDPPSYPDKYILDTNNAKVWI